MNFNEHFKLKGSHSFLGASKYHWIRYDEDKFRKAWSNHEAALRGTADHEFAALCIARGQKLPRSKQTLNMYVNDAIGFGLKPEVTLRYSDNAFATADAIDFKERKKLLQIFDLKTGVVPAHMEQLLVYAAYFCLEYKMRPSEFKTELRIYQNSDVVIYEPEVDEIVPIMDKIIHFNKIIEERKYQ